MTNTDNQIMDMRSAIDSLIRQVKAQAEQIDALWAEIQKAHLADGINRVIPAWARPPI